MGLCVRLCILKCIDVFCVYVSVYVFGGYLGVLWNVFVAII